MAEQGTVIRLRQCLAVQLAVGRQWHGIEFHVGHRHQHLGQLLLQLRAQGADGQGAVFGKPRHQTPFAHQHHGFADAVQGHQTAFDLAQFHAHSAHFDLIVIAAQVVEIAIGQPARQVAGAVHAASVERVLQEAFSGHLRLVEVTARHAAAAHIQLAHHAQRHRPQVRVEHVHAGVRNRPTDMQRLPHLHATGGGNHRGFGGAVVIDHRKTLRLTELTQAITTDQQRAQARVLQLPAECVFGHWRGQKAHIQRLRQPPGQQFVDVFIAHVGGRQVQGRAHAQRRPDLPGHRVKTETSQAAGVP
ncbi:hypothetical protein [Pseudomonas sp. 25 E 4]|nr:hypothetical protein [Pseudomonas sp. 25 E 4]